MGANDRRRSCGLVGRMPDGARIRMLHSLSRVAWRACQTGRHVCNIRCAAHTRWAKTPHAIDPVDLPRPRTGPQRRLQARAQRLREHNTQRLRTPICYSGQTTRGGGGAGRELPSAAYARWTWSKSRRQYELGSSCECLTAACVKTPQPLSENMLVPRFGAGDRDLNNVCAD